MAMDIMYLSFPHGVELTMGCRFHSRQKAYAEAPQHCDVYTAFCIRCIRRRTEKKLRPESAACRQTTDAALGHASPAWRLPSHHFPI